MNRIVTGDGRVHFGATAHINRNAPMSKADAEWLASKADVVTSGGHDYGAEQEAVFAAAGTLRAPYTKSAMTSAAGLPEDEYSHTLGGARRWNARWKVYETQPDSSWRFRHLEELKRLPSWSTAIFSDSAGRYAYDTGGKPAMPPDHRVEYTVSEYLALVGDNLDYWSSGTGRPILINGLSRETVKLYTPGVGMVEGAFRSVAGKLPDQRVWEDTASFVLQAQALGWTPWLLIKLRDLTQVDAWRSLTAPSALLLDAGSLLFDLCGMEGSDPPWVTREYDHPSYAPDIGLPLVTPTSLADLETTWSGVYKRQFERGSVWVNSTTSPVQLSRTRMLEPQSGRFWKRVSRKRP